MFKTDDTTDKGVSADNLDTDLDNQDVDEFADTEEKPKSQREIMMEQIYGKRIEDLKADGVKFEDDEEEDNEDNDEDDDDTSKLITVKVDGVEETLTQEELEKRIREYQKHKAADKRLEEAANKLKELEQLEATLKSKSQDKDDSDNKDDVDISTLEGYGDLFEKFANDIRDGNDKDAVEATKEFAKALTRLVPKATGSGSVDEQVREALAKVREEEEAKQKEEEQTRLDEEVDSAKKDFNKVYKEELKNDDFHALAIMEDNKLMKDPEWANKPLKERFLQAGENAKKWLEGKGSKQTAKDKKRNLKPIAQRSSNARLKDDDSGDSPLSPSDIIKEMKQQRGQMY